MHARPVEQVTGTKWRKAHIGWRIGSALTVVVVLALYIAYHQAPEVYGAPPTVIDYDDAAARGVAGYLRTHELVGDGSAAFVPANEKVGQIALTGSEKRYFGVPARVWAADGLTQIRDLPLTGTFTFSGPGITLAGAESAMTSATLGDGGNGITWGTATYTDTASGLTCSGPTFGKIINALGHLTLVAKCSDGSLLKGSLTDVETYPVGAAPPTWVRSEFNGVLSRPRP
ncbi:MAG: hypothetical protein U0822_26880 [Anaerolineae bacterium]